MALQEVNPDVFGWIYSPDTTINYPVVQGDDNAYYLKHLADGTENRNGYPFLDIQNRTDLTVLRMPDMCCTGSWWCSDEAAEAASVHRENPFIKPKTIEKTGKVRYSK